MDDGGWMKKYLNSLFIEMASQKQGLSCVITQRRKGFIQWPKRIYYIGEQSKRIKVWMLEGEQAIRA